MYKTSFHTQMIRVSFGILFLLVCNVALAQKRTKVACVGNSITYGATLKDPATQSYPAQLQTMLGTDYEVGNFGKSGATLLSRGHRPYIKQKEYKNALNYAADVVVIHLGINDTDPRDWTNYRDDFVGDYLRLIDSFRKVNPKVRILIARMTPIGDSHRRFLSGTRDWHDAIQAAIETVAECSGVELIDFHAPLYPYPTLLPDAVHPNLEGSGILARTVYSAITGDYGGLQLPCVYTDNMVLQRDTTLTISGKANAGEKVTVELGKKKYSATTAKNGYWQVEVPPLSAGGPLTMKVSTKNRTLTLQNVLVGEVWLCSGQSNMEFMLRYAKTAKDASQAADDELRLFDMRRLWRTDAVEWDSTVLDSLNHLKYFAHAQWQESSPKTAIRFSAIAYYFGRMLRDSLQVPVGLICNAVGGSPTEAWIDRSTVEHQFPQILKDWKKNELVQDWVRQRATLNIGKSSDPKQRHPYQPCYLFESAIMPLEHYCIKGCVWYQGESNAHNIEAHEQLFPLLVESWRKYWDNEALPFYYVQLSSIDRPSWTWFRDSQRRLMQRLSRTGMAVSSDRGDSLDVHPKDKKPIGERLARWALNDAYGHKNVVPSGPLPTKASLKGNDVIVSFDYGQGMKTSDGEPIRTFEVAETDGLFYPAEAEVSGDGAVRVRSKQVKRPRFVRYGWQPFTRANLVNSTNLPTTTFRLEVKE